MLFKIQVSKYENLIRVNRLKDTLLLSVVFYIMSLYYQIKSELN